MDSILGPGSPAPASSDVRTDWRENRQTQIRPVDADRRSASRQASSACWRVVDEEHEPAGRAPGDGGGDAAHERRAIGTGRGREPADALVAVGQPAERVRERERRHVELSIRPGIGQDRGGDRDERAVRIACGRLG